MYVYVCLCMSMYVYVCLCMSMYVYLYTLVLLVSLCEFICIPHTQVFIVPLQEHNDHVPVLQPLLTDLQVIVGYNSILLTDLTSRLEHWTPDSKMGDIFLKIVR
jgi:hypothetical protein